MITIKRGDLLDAKEKIIGHQVNCFGAAGGLAAAVFEKWPRAGKIYSHFAKDNEGDQHLGTTMIIKEKDEKRIANIYGQYYPGDDYRPEELELALCQLAVFAKQNNYSVALPYKLSCGICGGDWNEVLKIIERTMVGVNCVIYQREGDE